MKNKPAVPARKGRGAQLNPHNPFENTLRDKMPDPDLPDRTCYQEVFPKSMINRVDSPDIGMAWSMNPYQGCEHGCVYCYARNTHPFWGFSAGLDFEQNILVKKDAPELLRKQLQKNSWRAAPIMLSGNTDCYQPAERKFEVTRRLLEVLWAFRHPVGIITKSRLILRDLDLLAPMAAEGLVHVAISVTSLDEQVRRLLEPRTASAAARLQVIRRLSEQGIPVRAMLAPIIPGLNDHEILPMARAVADCGARAVHHTVVRLNGDVAEIFEDWVRKTMPDRAGRILNRIRDCHDGRLSDSRFGRRITGSGRFAELIGQQMDLARRLYFEDRKMPPYNLDSYRKRKHPQLALWE